MLSNHPIQQDTLEDECTYLGLSKAQFVLIDKSPKLAGQIVINHLGSFTSGMIFNLLCVLYVDCGVFVFESKSNIEGVNTLLYNLFACFGL